MSSPSLADPRPAVLVLGANGRIGRAAVEAFARAGWRVVAQVRHDHGSWPAGVQGVARGLDDTAALVADVKAAASRAATGAGPAAGAIRAVVYAVNPPYTRWDAELLPLARQGFAVAAALGALCLLPGNVYGYGEGMPATLTADTPQHPTTSKGRQRVAMEAELAAWPGLRSVVLRAGDFFGAGTGAWLDLVIARDLLPGGRGRRLVYPGPVDRVHAWAYLPDLAQAFVAVAELDDGIEKHRALPFAGHAVTGADFLAALRAAAARRGLAPPGGWRQGALPWPLVRLAGLVWPMGRELARMRYLWERPHALDGTALQAAAGRLPATPLVDALEAALRDLGVGAPKPANASPGSPALPRTTDSPAAVLRPGA